MYTCEKWLKSLTLSKENVNCFDEIHVQSRLQMNKSCKNVVHSTFGCFYVIALSLSLGVHFTNYCTLHQTSPLGQREEQTVNVCMYNVHIYNLNVGDWTEKYIFGPNVNGECWIGLDCVRGW